VDSQHHGAEDDGHQYNMPVPCNASDPKAALAVKTSPSKWTRSITAPKMVVVDVTRKYHATHQIQRLHLQLKKAIKVGSQYHGAEDDDRQCNMPVPCNALDPKAALAVKTSP
jgi:hypothetical protein